MVDASIMEYLHHKTAACLKNIAPQSKDLSDERGWKRLADETAYLTAVMKSMLSGENWTAISNELSAKALAIKEEVKAVYPDPVTETFLQNEEQKAGQQG